MKMLPILCLAMVACSHVDKSVHTDSAPSQPDSRAADTPILDAEAAAVKRGNVVIDAEKNTLYLPVKPGTHLAALDPAFKVAPGYHIQPAGPQNFSGGPVTYTLYKQGRRAQTFKVSAATDGNPVLEGYYADPEIIFSERDGKYYLYPTTDGHTDWSGTYFESFSSPDLLHWQNEGIILDLERDVTWADRHAWAPAAAERLIDGKYRYFYYFTAAQKIGVAVAENPQGPFIDSGRPLIAFKPDGVTGGQEIDPDVFFDPVSKKSYLYWGNGYLAVAELNEDMVSIKRETLQIITPDASYREGTEVFYREGTYYFLWSENDTRDEDYRVRYATAPSPVGPLHIPENNLILAKNPAAGIYGTGHNSVVRVPGKDCWYIVYHRFNRPHGIGMGRAAGFHREVAIDLLEFDNTGKIKPVRPGLKGLASGKAAACLKK